MNKLTQIAEYLGNMLMVKPLLFLERAIGLGASAFVILLVLFCFLIFQGEGDLEYFLTDVFTAIFGSWP